MAFQISGLKRQQFEALFLLDDTELERQNIIRNIVSEYPGTPCRISLKDVAIGETVLLLNYQHQPGISPYQASHAIYVSQTAVETNLSPNFLPESIINRLISVRAFDAQHLMLDADVAEGTKLEPIIQQFFRNPEVAYLHLHNAKMGCFAATVKRG